jgi:hypothetical protein
MAILCPDEDQVIQESLASRNFDNRGHQVSASFRLYPVMPTAAFGLYTRNF